MDDNIETENVTLNEFINFFNLTGTNVTNNSDVSPVQLFDLYEVYRSREKEQLILYKWIAYVLGSVIMVSNLTVVISSGLILRKGQQHKSTYLLLGNVSLADTIIGFSIIFGASIEHSLGSNQLCIFQLGMLVCPAIVSVFSVGFIAIDRYIYILHGLYYQRWFNATRVRIGIVCIWIIGICLGFPPTAGWINHTLIHTSRCNYTAVYPESLLLIISILSTIPLFIVAILYTVILFYALKNLKKINLTEKSVKSSSSSFKSSDEPKLRINRNTPVIKLNTKTTHSISVKFPTQCDFQFKRSASFCAGHSILFRQGLKTKSKSNDDLNINTLISSQAYVNRIQNNRDGRNSNFSVYTIASSVNELTATNQAESPSKESKCKVRSCFKKKFRKKRPNKLRAIAIVTLTSLSFIVTWLPYFVTAICFVLCKDKLTNPKCLKFRLLLVGPLATLAFINSMLNPLIYAWWHKGFQKSIKNLCRKYLQNYFFKR